MGTISKCQNIKILSYNVILPFFPFCEGINIFLQLPIETKTLVLYLVPIEANGFPKNWAKND